MTTSASKQRLNGDLTHRRTAQHGISQIPTVATARLPHDLFSKLFLDPLSDKIRPTQLHVPRRELSTYSRVLAGDIGGRILVEGSLPPTIALISIRFGVSAAAMVCSEKRVFAGGLSAADFSGSGGFSRRNSTMTRIKDYGSQISKVMVS